MSISFPATPTPGQIYQNWVWNATAGTWDAALPGMMLQLRKVVFTTGSGSYVPSPGTFQIEVEMVGGGSSGWGGNGANAGTATTFGTSFLTCNGGALPAATNSAPVANGGTASGGDINIRGGDGDDNVIGAVSGQLNATGGAGGASPFGGAGRGTSNQGTPGGNASPNTGSGGGGAGIASTTGYYGNQGGGAGGYLRKLISNPAASYPYTVGVGGAGAGVSGGTGASGAGGSGVIYITEYCWITQAAVAAQAASGARVLLMAQTVSTPVASVDFTTGIDTTYDEYVLEIQNASAGTANALTALRFATGGAFDIGPSNYQTQYFYMYGDGVTAPGSGGGATAQFYLSSSVLATGGLYSQLDGTVRIFRPWDTVNRKFMMGESVSFNGSPVWTKTSFSGNYVPSTSVTGIRFFYTSGNVATGTFKLYGIQK